MSKKIYFLIILIPILFSLLMYSSAADDYDMEVDSECEYGIKLSHVVLVVINNVNRHKDICTGSIVSPGLVVTSGGCCHTARSITVNAFYNYTLKKWTQTRSVSTTSVMVRQENALPSDYLCVMRLQEDLDLNPITDKVEFYNESLTQDHVLDVIAILYFEKESKYKVVCFIAEMERNQSCSEYFRHHFHNNSWHTCLTNGFIDSESCLGVDGAVVQYDNKIIGLLKNFLESCATAKYGFMHSIETNREFIEMILTRGKCKSTHKSMNINNEEKA